MYFFLYKIIKLGEKVIYLSINQKEKNYERFRINL